MKLDLKKIKESMEQDGSLQHLCLLGQAVLPDIVEYAEELEGNYSLRDQQVTLMGEHVKALEAKVEGLEKRKSDLIDEVLHQGKLGQALKAKLSIAEKALESANDEIRHDDRCSGPRRGEDFCECGVTELKKEIRAAIAAIKGDQNGKT